MLTQKDQKKVRSKLNSIYKKIVSIQVSFNNKIKKNISKYIKKGFIKSF